jgi:hypothetical protein
MQNDLYNKRNGRKLAFLYPIHGNRNILRNVEGLKAASFTGPGGRGVKVTESNGETHSFLLSKCVVSL